MLTSAAACLRHACAPGCVRASLAARQLRARPLGCMRACLPAWLRARTPARLAARAHACKPARLGQLRACLAGGHARATRRAGMHACSQAGGLACMQGQSGRRTCMFARSKGGMRECAHARRLACVRARRQAGWRECAQPGGMRACSQADRHAAAKMQTCGHACARCMAARRACMQPGRALLHACSKAGRRTCIRACSQAGMHARAHAGLQACMRTCAQARSDQERCDVKVARVTASSLGQIGMLRCFRVGSRDVLHGGQTCSRDRL